MLIETEVNGVDFYRINKDVNGNPRYVFHYTELCDDYEKAHKIALKLGARKYTAKWYVGGFVIQSYNLQRTSLAIIAEALRPITKELVA